MGFSDAFTGSVKKMTEILIKSIGACLIIASSLFYGATMIREEHRRLIIADALAEMIRYVRDHIDHFRTPIPDILDSFENKTLEDCGFLTAARERGLRVIADDFPASVREADRDVSAALRDFCVGIGCGYKDEELRLCDYTLGRIMRRIEQLRADHDGKVKIYRTLPPLFALSVILIIV